MPHLLSYSLCFGHDSLHFAMLTLTQDATKTRILGSTTHSPRFGGKKWNLLFTVTIYLSLFIVTIHWTIHCYYSLRIFAYLRGAVPYIWSKCFVCLVQDFFLRESFPLRAFLCENILAYYKLPTFSTKLVTPKPCNYFQLVITTTVSVQFYFQ